jgi:Family of unknown function (DUF6188)
MDKLPDTDWSFLTGKRVDQICIGLYQIQLNLSDSVSVSIEGRFAHKGLHGTSNEEAMPKKACTLISLLGSTVERAGAEDERTLIIEFSNEEILKIFVAGAPYESFSVTAPGKTITA